jgi:hypothetical protein
MTGACHHLRPAAVFYDDRPQAQKAVLSIAGAKIRKKAEVAMAFPVT